MIRSVVLSMLASLWPNGSTQRARVSRLDYRRLLLERGGFALAALPP
jgi:hypothetical protein